MAGRPRLRRQLVLTRFGRGPDLAALPDLSTPAADLSALPDLGTPADMTNPPDLLPTTDMTALLTNVPGNCQSGATSAQVYAIVSTTCAGGGCHIGGGVPYWTATDGASLKAAWVGVVASEVANGSKMPRVTASNINQSYVMYKILGEQVQAGGSGGQMPLGMAPLTNNGPTSQVCQIVSWINGGAK